MNFIDAPTLRKRMNNATKDYLFGIDFELQQGFFIENPKKNTEILWRVGEHSNFHTSKSDKNSYLKANPLSFDSYLDKFTIIRNALQRGDSFLTNLTIKTHIETNCTGRDIALHCDAPYVLMLPGKFVCFSPETFVTIKRGIITSHPMKGTINADIPNAAQQLLDNPKELAEHNTIVDLLRNDLSMVASEVHLETFRYMDIIDTFAGKIIQTSSLITGKLTQHYSQNMGDTLFEILPAGSVSGAPKADTLKIIKHAEGELRGFYCGVFGYAYENMLQSAVLIRYIEENENGECYFRSGSGVTVYSNAKEEYDECIQKIYLPSTFNSVV